MLNYMLEIYRIQQEYFQILAEFFERATGKSATAFASPDSFGEAIKKDSEKIAKRAEDAFPWGVNALVDFYNRHKTSAFQSAREIGGMKLVLGGSSQFTNTHLQAVRKMLLYADTILIPDPILPWIEVEREEENFPHTKLLQNIFILLHLKPLVDANLSYPAIIVFPSYEKSLETKDDETKQGIDRLVSSFFSYYTGKKFVSMKDILNYACTSEKEFLQQVEKNRLFIPPDGVTGSSITKAVEDYRQYIKSWRSEQHAKTYLSLPDGALVMKGISERLAPQWHLLENADELHAQPMLCLNAHWHYYTLCASMYQGRLLESNLLKPETVNTLRALSGHQFEWLGNIPIEIIAKLREQNENEEFRKTLSSFTSELNKCAIDDIDRVTSEVCRGIASLLSEHKKRVKEISDKYTLLYKKTLVASWVTLAATFVPTLAPFVALVSPLALAGKYAWDKTGEITEKKQLSHSLMGVLASVKGNIG